MQSYVLVKTSFSRDLPSLPPRPSARAAEEVAWCMHAGANMLALLDNVLHAACTASLLPTMAPLQLASYRNGNNPR